LDTGSLAILVASGQDYGAMTFTGGFYTNCTGTDPNGYHPLSNEVYGYIEHTRSGITMQMVAGVHYDFPNNSMLNGQ
jgi:hypothetical protein